MHFPSCTRAEARNQQANAQPAEGTDLWRGTAPASSHFFVVAKWRFRVAWWDRPTKPFPVMVGHYCGVS
jgi:hypothetical protein